MVHARIAKRLADVVGQDVARAERHGLNHLHGAARRIERRRKNRLIGRMPVKRVAHRNLQAVQPSQQRIPPFFGQFQHIAITWQRAEKIDAAPL